MPNSASARESRRRISTRVIPSLPYWLARQRQKRELLGEELRLLYVAMTRARDRLLLVGSVIGKTIGNALAKRRGKQFHGSRAGAKLCGLAGSVVRENCAAANTDAGETEHCRWTLHDDASLVDETRRRGKWHCENNRSPQQNRNGTVAPTNFPRNIHSPPRQQNLRKHPSPSCAVAPWKRSSRRKPWSFSAARSRGPKESEPLGNCGSKKSSADVGTAASPIFGARLVR